MQDCVLLRYGEVGLKSKKTRMFFEKKYVLAIKESLSRNNISDFLIKNFGGRFVVFCENSEEITNLLLTVPGIQSASPAKKILVISKKLLIMKLKKELKE
ncbi:MAG: hypothetical protein KKF89_00840, partial [Nanoarchaeota archaeon]|nr:hypothetical protein [Nanoarchaeota archaeon]MBU1854243.1 hypothetical protein [Nanoarchaeota archaeon]